MIAGALERLCLQMPDTARACSRPSSHLIAAFAYAACWPTRSCFFVSAVYFVACFLQRRILMLYQDERMRMLAKEQASRGAALGGGSEAELLQVCPVLSCCACSCCASTVNALFERRQVVPTCSAVTFLAGIHLS